MPLPFKRQGISKLLLTRFRSYASLALSCTTDPVVLTGPNGAGKTNLLEALSLLSPGRGCRQAKLMDLQQQGSELQGPWAVSVGLESQDAAHRVGTSAITSPTGREGRRVFINGQEGLPQTRLSDVVNVLWLTPMMDRLFLEGATARRKFLDRLVYSFDSQHASRINRFELCMRERNRLLADHSCYHSWLSSLEKQMCAEAFTILLARQRTLGYLQGACEKGRGPFPCPLLSLKGTLEENFSQESETFMGAYAQLLESCRPRDQAAGRTFMGPHATDFMVHYKEKNMPAHQCSTGEQKALLVAIILAAARLKAQDQGAVTLILLDEVVAHLDVHRRQALLQEIVALPLQAWMTGTDPSFFAPIRDAVQHFHVESSVLTGIDRRAV